MARPQFVSLGTILCVSFLSLVCVFSQVSESLFQNIPPSSVAGFQEESGLILCQGVYGHKGLSVPCVSKQVP